MKRKTNLKIEIWNLKFYLCLCVFTCGLIFFLNLQDSNVSAENSTDEIEKAIFTRQEFFGASAIVPIPTAEARENLSKLAENSPDDLKILEKLAEYEEKISRFNEAEKTLIRLSAIDASKRESLVAFYHRRAEFEKEADVIKQILFSTDAEDRAYYFERLTELARRHDLPQYLNNDFFRQITKENPDIFDVFERIIKNLTETENYDEALKFVRMAKTQFPANHDFLLEKEVELLLLLDKSDEAEEVYQAAFDASWDETEAEKFYDFLDSRDRLRAYGAEIKSRFHKNPADFDAAIRLALYQDHDNEYGNDSAAPIILRLEQNKKSWTTEELVTATRILLRANDAELASRFLYTLYVREDFKQNSELRAKILYQLFEMFSDAEKRKLPITKGDLSFYEDIAKADVNPGITSGILSLIFSDSNPKAKLKEQETEANRYFNRVAAYRIFEEYKKENLNSPELAQMYLDIIRLYTATRETEIAEKTLNEFAEKYADSKDFADAALKLADAFIAAKNEEKAREVYRKLLDFLGKQKKFHTVKKQKTYEDFDSENEETTEKVSFDRNKGINIPTTEKPQNEYYSDKTEGNFNDHLATIEDEITYEEILEKLVSLYSKDKKTGEILALYSNEIQKYPNEEWLYEQRLAWLEQTSLTEEKLQFYKLALEQFQTRSWQDKLARFFIRENRRDDFAAFSQDLIGKLNDDEIQSYLSQFAEPKQFQGELEKRIYLKLYTSAHEKFPHNIFFVSGLLQFYENNGQTEDWRKLCAEYYFESKEIREKFLDHLAKKGELRTFLENAKNDSSVYELFRADAFVQLSNYENAISAYRKLNELYPNSPEFSERLISFTRSFGQKDRAILSESANLAKAQADNLPSSAIYQTTSGEIFAELGNYEKAREEWRKLIVTEKGEKEIYLETATVFWDYFQYDDALETIQNLRGKYSDDTLYAFETGALHEAKHEQDHAITEYIKALAATDENENQKSKAVNRLAILASRSQENVRRIETAFATKKDKNADYVSLGFAEYLFKTNNYEKAENILSKAINNSSDENFLADAKDFYELNELILNKNFASGKRNVLKKMAETTDTPRLKITYSLELAESFQENNEPEKAKNILQNIVRQFPTNYGVLVASSARLDDLGFETDAAKILQNALPKSKGFYRTSLAEKLSKILIRTNQADSAERILVELHAQNPEDKDIFRELVKVCIRTAKADLMRKSFAETVAEIKKSDEERRFIDEEIAGLRSEMIDAFTRLKDYRSAVEQHIEIINREPENEELTESAIRYVQRYGGAETLLNYYLKTSAEAFKNYRWNLVLARIYEANNDSENAAKNYKNAIQNQPEMFELYLSLAEIETKRGNFDAAIENINEVLMLTNDQKEYVKKKIEILKKAGRYAEIEAEKAKLPEEEERKIVTDEFAEAQKLQFSEKEKARELFRTAFAKLLENPIKEDFSAANISSYVTSLREEESLDQINQNLWNLREKLVEIGNESNSTDSGEARKRLQILESAMTEAIGNLAKTIATDEELKNLHEFLASKIDENSLKSNSVQTFSLAQNMSRRAGFGDLEEKILIKKIEENLTVTDRQIHLQNLANFYNARGAYQKTFDALEKYESSDSIFKAEIARIVGNKQKEIEYLHDIYWKTNEKAPKLNDENLARFFEILYAENRDELKALTEKNTRYQLPLINFLLGKGERELTHSAIQNSAFSEAWKVSRHAETSLALKEFDDQNECYFCDALQFDSVGNLTAQTPDKKRFLINNDWFRLSREYGEWLLAKDDKTIPPAKFLTAMIENQPKNAVEQFKLGRFYFEKNEMKSAIEHLRLAVELEPQNTEFWANLGAFYLKAGKDDFAEKCFEKTLAENSNESYRLYFQTLEKYGFAEKAREKLQPKIIEALEKADVDDYQEMQELIHNIVVSFKNDTEKSAYFKEILRQRPTDKSLVKMLLDENLLEENSRSEFFKIAISRSEKLNQYDYDFRSISERVWSQADAESVYEQENDFQMEAPQNERIEWQRKYLELLLEQKNSAEAKKIIGEIEAELNGKFARPVWLRAAKINLQIRGGKTDFAEIERFIGVSVSDAATEIIPPNVERFNAILEILTTEKREAEMLRLKESFFARMLALEQFEVANFVGFARVLFEKSDTERALQILLLMTLESRETALAEISEFAEIKAKSADSVKFQNGSNSFPAQSVSLKTAAEIAFELDQNETAIEFRRKLTEIVPNDVDNKIELAEILTANDKKAEGFEILHGIIADRNAFRSARWQARKILVEAGETIEIPNDKFDSFSQFYNGLFAQKSAQTHTSIECFLSSLIADQETQLSAKQELIRIYAATGNEKLALKIAENEKTPKSDELLQILSEAAERIGNFQKAVEFENAKTSPNAERIANLQKLNDIKNQKATDFTVDAENTRKI